MITCSFEDCRSTHGASGKRQFNCESSSAASLRNILNFCFLTCSLYIYLYEFHSASPFGVTVCDHNINSFVQRALSQQRA